MEWATTLYYAYSFAAWIEVSSSTTATSVQFKFISLSLHFITIIISSSSYFVEQLTLLHTSRYVECFWMNVVDVVLYIVIQWVLFLFVIPSNCTYFISIKLFLYVDIRLQRSLILMNPFILIISYQHQSNNGEMIIMMMIIYAILYLCMYVFLQ